MNITNKPKITVIIPTRERCAVLESSLRTATMQNYDNLEIIVSDNFSSDDTTGVVQRANDSRIKYLNTGKRLSMSHNWEFALSHVEDGWVTFMGDDDGLLPDALCKVANIIETTKAKVVRSDYCAYDWPNTGEHPGQLIVPLSSGVETRNSKQWLRKALSGQARYSQLPMIYNGGFIRISVLNRIKDRLGCYFSSAIPDVFTAVAIAKLEDDYLYVREPLCISGTSRHSNGYSSFSVEKQRNLEAYKQFLSEPNLPYHRDIPIMPDDSFPLSLQICIYEAYLQSMALGSPIAGIDHTQQLAVIFATSGKHRRAIDVWGKAFAEQHGIDYSRTYRSAAWKRPLLQLRTLSQKASRVFHSIISDDLIIKNIHEASIAAAIIRSNPGRGNSMRFLVQKLLASIKFQSNGRKA